MCVFVVVIVHWHCSAQLSMFNMEKRYINKIIIIIRYDLTRDSWVLSPCLLLILQSISTRPSRQ